MKYLRKHDGLDKLGKNKFIIIDNDGKSVKDKKVLEYIKNLVIPPNYRDVTIFMDKSPKILFEGYDAANRLQQIYSKEHKAKAAKKKYCDLIEFGKTLPKMEADIKKNMESDEDSLDKIVSIIITIVTLCGFRIGNFKYEKLYNSFGISNIHTNHVKETNKGLTIKFKGKKSIINECTITDKKLIKIINDLLSTKKEGDYVFIYNDGVVQKPVSAIDINSWLKKYHVNITSKMFRTYYTNLSFIEQTRKHPNPEKMNTVQRKKKVVIIMKTVSDEINNTPTVAKKEYLHNGILEMYLDKPKEYNKKFINKHDSGKCFLAYLESLC